MSEINLKINLSYGDEYMSANITRDAMLWQFICWGIFLPIVSLIGLVGNALTIVVLWRKEMQSTTILYMRGLVLTDTGKCVGVCVGRGGEVCWVCVRVMAIAVLWRKEMQSTTILYMRGLVLTDTGKCVCVFIAFFPPVSAGV
jgi:hypothetical protein